MSDATIHAEESGGRNERIVNEGSEMRAGRMLPAKQRDPHQLCLHISSYQILSQQPVLPAPLALPSYLSDQLCCFD